MKTHDFNDVLEFNVSVVLDAIVSRPMTKEEIVAETGIDGVDLARAIGFLKKDGKIEIVGTFEPIYQMTRTENSVIPLAETDKKEEVKVEEFQPEEKKEEGSLEEIKQEEDNLEEIKTEHNMLEDFPKVIYKSSMISDARVFEYIRDHPSSSVRDLLNSDLHLTYWQIFRSIQRLLDKKMIVKSTITDKRVIHYEVASSNQTTTLPKLTKKTTSHSSMDGVKQKTKRQRSEVISFILKSLEENGRLSIEQLINTGSYTRVQIAKALREMLQSDMIVKNGKSINTTYSLKSNVKEDEAIVISINGQRYVINFNLSEVERIFRKLHLY